MTEVSRYYGAPPIKRSAHKMKKQKPYYECRVVLNPKERGLVAGSNIKNARVYADHIRIGREEYDFSSIKNIELKNSAILFSTGQEMIRFAHDGYQSKGSHLPQLTGLLSTLVKALANENLSQAKQAAKTLIRIRRMMNVRTFFHVFFLIAYVAITVSAFTIFPNLPNVFSKHPIWAVVIGLAGISALSYWTAELATLLVAKNINRRTSAPTLSQAPPAQSDA